MYIVNVVKIGQKVEAIDLLLTGRSHPEIILRHAFCKANVDKIEDGIERWKVRVEVDEWLAEESSHKSRNS